MTCRTDDATSEGTLPQKPPPDLHVHNGREPVTNDAKQVTPTNTRMTHNGEVSEAQIGIRTWDNLGTSEMS